MPRSESHRRGISFAHPFLKAPLGSEEGWGVVPEYEHFPTAPFGALKHGLRAQRAPEPPLQTTVRQAKFRIAGVGTVYSFSATCHLRLIPQGWHDRLTGRTPVEKSKQKMTLEQKLAGIEAAQMILQKARFETVNLFPAWKKLNNASRSLDKELADLMADDQGNN